ncbi:MAG: hypothetical protein C3F13_03375 [Anaerolineales bacterium]|nr:hypothetical protein [Anaerolineae bacterium]PWB55726.1 MAG: hypothetical protein C3F13_03375 [Anaerolineales bacterium]
MTTLSSFPPRGILVPTSMIFNQQLPAAVLVTWIQLRALAWRGWSTPALSLAEMASILGIHPTRLEKHLYHLQHASALSLHATGSGKLILSFPTQPVVAPDEQPEPIHLDTVPPPLAQERHTLKPPSYFPHQILGYLTYDASQESLARQETPVSVSLESDEALLSLDRITTLCSQELI